MANPNKKPLCNDATFKPPASLVRPRNGKQSGDALGTEAISGLDGGGKSPRPFIPIAEHTKPRVD